MGRFETYVEFVGQAMEGAGVAIIALGAVLSTLWFVRAVVRRGAREAYGDFRRVLGRAILLGLEFLVAGDIIRTVAVTPTLEGVAVLSVIVVIRTFLSWTLALEVEGRWPWQQRPPRPE